MRMHSKQMIKPGLSRCITVPKMRGLKPRHMHSMSKGKSQQQEQRQQQRGVRTTRFREAVRPVSHTREADITIQAALAVKRLGPCARCSLTVPAPADPAPCPVFAALSYL